MDNILKMCEGSTRYRGRNNFGGTDNLRSIQDREEGSMYKRWNKKIFKIKGRFNN